MTPMLLEELHHSVGYFAATLATNGGGNEVTFRLVAAQQCRHPRLTFLLRHEVDLVDDQPAGFVVEGLVVLA